MGKKRRDREGHPKALINTGFFIKPSLQPLIMYNKLPVVDASCHIVL